jgi:RNA polymerase sigma factor (sigma-70 family)
LQRFVRHADEAAFKRVVDEHTALVFHTACRRLNGDHALAQDATQIVFGDLLRKADQLPEDTVLAGWLHRQTRFVTAKQVRSEERRRNRESASASETTDAIEEPGHLWREIRTLIDGALTELGETDQNLLLHRFWRGMSLRDAGAAAGLSENAAQKRISRSFDQLRVHLQRYGVTGSVATLTLAVSGNVASGAPAGLAATVMTTALSSQPTFLQAFNPADWFLSLKAKPIAATAFSLIAVALGTTGFVSGQGAARRHHQAVAWQTAVDRAEAHVVSFPIEKIAPIGPLTNSPAGVVADAQTEERKHTIREIIRKAAGYMRNPGAKHEAWALSFVEARRIPPDRIVEAISELEKFRDDPEVFEGLGPILAGILATQDPARALAWISENFEDVGLDVAMGQVLQGWAKKDPIDAWKWYSETTLSGELPIRQSTWTGQADEIFARLTAHDPTAAFAQLGELPTQLERGAFSGISDAAIGSPKREEILLQLGTMADERSKRRIARGLASDWAKGNPAEAAQWAETINFRNPSAKLDVIGEVAEEWFPGDPHGAATWVLINTPDSLRAEVAEKLKEALQKFWKGDGR